MENAYTDSPAHKRILDLLLSAYLLYLVQCAMFHGCAKYQKRKRETATSARAQAQGMMKEKLRLVPLNAHTPPGESSVGAGFYATSK